MEKNNIKTFSSSYDRMSTTQYLITIGEPNPDDPGIFSDEWIETLITVGRFIERFHTDSDYLGKYVYVTEYVLADDGRYVTHDDLFRGRYIIE